MNNTRTAKHNRLGQKRARKYRHAYLSIHPCVDCGEADIRILEFDHRPGTQKVNEVSSMHSIYKIQAEIDKCDVRCSSCHRLRHAAERRLAKTSNHPLKLGEKDCGGCPGGEPLPPPNHQTSELISQNDETKDLGDSSFFRNNASATEIKNLWVI